MENKNINLEAEENEKTEAAEEVTHEQTLKLMSPMQMVIRRFFRSKLSIVGLIAVPFLLGGSSRLQSISHGDRQGR